MANVTFDSLIPGEAYDRRYLAALWGYEGHQAISRGVITPAGQRILVLFVTRIKQTGYVQYENRFDGDILYMEGERGDAATNARLKNAGDNGDRIFLFFRERHHSPFIYYGEAKLTAVSETSERIHFTFATERSDVIASNALATEEAAHGAAPYTPDEEGRQRLAMHVSYERSRNSRAQAIRIHGTICAACHFDFNAFYGAELARDYIEIHHFQSIAAGERSVDPVTDLVPLCANCHAIVHRTRGSILSVAALRERINKARAAVSLTR